ncbi:MAG TPA: ABC transporter permease [Alphaproteobacteria bacterium]|nr:ABC transporter permease [Alphaproteobacteria bacterium]
MTAIEFAPARGGTLRRIVAVVLRYVYLLRRSWPRLFELFYWTTLQMVLWGMINRFMAGESGWFAQSAGVLIAAVMLWEVLFRGQLGLSISFMEELWSRNLGHLMVSPLRPGEWVLSLVVISFIRTVIALCPAALLAIPLYQFNVFEMGLPLVAYFFLLLALGWSLGLAICAMLLRFGLGAESLAWMAVFILAPVSAVYYPLSALPEWAQWIGWFLPSAHVFEGMRATLFEGVFRWDHFAWALGLDIVFLAGGAWSYLAMFHVARRRGSLLQGGE